MDKKRKTNMDKLITHFFKFDQYRNKLRFYITIKKYNDNSLFSYSPFELMYEKNKIVSTLVIWGHNKYLFTNLLEYLIANNICKLINYHYFKDFEKMNINININDIKLIKMKSLAFVEKNIDNKICYELEFINNSDITQAIIEGL